MIKCLNVSASKGISKSEHSEWFARSIYISYIYLQKYKQQNNAREQLTDTNVYVIMTSI